MYDGDAIRLLLAKQKKSQRDLSMAVTGKPNSSLHNLYKNPTASTIEKVADFFNVTIDSLFVRTRQPIDYATETDMENGYLKHAGAVKASCGRTGEPVEIYSESSGGYW